MKPGWIKEKRKVSQPHEIDGRASEICKGIVFNKIYKLASEDLRIFWIE